MSQHASLYKKIVITTLIITFLVGSVSTILVSMLAYQETQDISEEHLKNIAELIANQGDDFEEFAIIDSDHHQRFATDDGDDGVVIDVFAHPSSDDDEPNTTNSSPLQSLPNGESIQMLDGEEWLVYKKNNQDTIIVVRERLDHQKELAWAVAMTSLIPFLIAMGLIGLGFLWILWRAFIPVQKLAHDITQRDDNDLSAVTEHRLPKEILPFITAINALLAKSREHIAKQERFIADVSHELRSPLTAIRLQIQRLTKLNQAQSHTDFSHELANLEQSVKRNQDMVEQLLMLARLKSEHKQHTTTNLTPIITDIINLMLPIIDDKSLEIEHIGQPIHIMGDETVIMLLLKNLIQNALRHTPVYGKITLITTDINNKDLHDLGKCVIKASVNHAHVLQIIDTGDGIDEVDYQNAFEPFVRLGAERSDSSLGGTGLGLAMVKNICQELNISLYLSPTTDIRYNPNQQQKGLCVSLVW